MKRGIAILAAIGMLLTDSICVGAQNNASDDLEDIIIAVGDNMVTVPKNQEEEAIEELFGIGERVAEDKGGAIQGYRIDEYRGIGRGSLTGFSNGNRTVKYIRTQ